MDSGIKRTQKDYTLAFKLAVVEQVEKGELTYKQAQDRYGIQGRSTVLVWLRKHGRQNWGPMAHYGRMSKPNPSPNSRCCRRPARRFRRQILRSVRGRSGVYRTGRDGLRCR